ncbi:tautomerase family protein [Paracoccus shandongensis]|uniref:tautomerase family protein n=1 Tax=Paracoccus shandongensis TaxID=2816048 RepID=UPI001A8D2760|nr:4-oxalocrotonate tautomerase family protein [Paracoccus shandongensis]
MPLVRIELFPGRSPELKQEIASRITQMLSDVAGIAPGATSVIFQETPPADWFVAGRSHAAAAAHGRID